MLFVHLLQSYQDQAVFVSITGDANESNKRLMTRLEVKQVRHVQLDKMMSFFM